MQEQLKRDIARLSHMRWTSEGDEVTVSRHHIGEQYADLTTQLRLLRAIQFSSAEAVGLFILYEQNMNQEAITSLQGIPDWVGTLQLLDCEWLLEPAAYVELGRALPPTCRVLGARYSKAPIEVVRSICVGASERRQGADAVQLSVGYHADCAPEWFGEHVLLCAESQSEYGCMV